jgi:hypothetical protein
MTTAIGFTGTRNQLSRPQAKALAQTLERYANHIELHHGDCIGADALAHTLAKSLGWRVISHPAEVAPAWRAFMPADEVRAPRPPLERNQDIVDETVWLIACPGADREEIRSGTWMTVRAARKAGRPITLIWPDGHIDVELTHPSEPPC